MTDFGFPVIPPVTDHDRRVKAEARAEYEAFAVERGFKALTPVEVGYVHGSRGIWPADFVAACERRLNREADAEVAEHGSVTE